MKERDEIISQAEMFVSRLPSLTRPIIHNHFRTGFAVDTKRDDSPVTIADKEVESCIRSAIAHQFPEHDIIGEEQGGQAQGRYCWIIDPIDGTRAFIVGKPLFGTLVAFAIDGKPVCGLVDMPILNETYLTQSDSAILLDAKGQRTIRTSSCIHLAQAQIATTSPDAFDERGMRVFEAVSKSAAGRHFGGDCYNYALLAAGYLDCVMENQLALHDMMALVPVLEKAGATVTDWSGNAIDLDCDGSLLVTATAELHKEIVEKIAHSS